ncbi:Uncharacterised protein [Burkholderia pseudomallei]|nr:hypothetical protein AQ956_18120 [Burkholderia pseudomallei]CAJ3420443.1 Uncharacterised protein [Burkholderia pseudomallei]CAJ3423537.1 Uncharacterised protein [Burkholderia pseudomallei]CAJ3948855.1 Uncharacterised protein [Burkholderia pseudomallei]CAJ4022233.1 Uncharacterised protein [Burkholderia pseudomallei]
MPPPMILSLSLSLSLSLLPMPMPMLLLLLLVQVLMLVLVLVLVPGWAGPSRVGVATAAALAAATIRSPPRHPRGESVLYYKS